MRRLGIYALIYVPIFSYVWATSLYRDAKELAIQSPADEYLSRMMEAQSVLATMILWLMLGCWLLVSYVANDKDWDIKIIARCIFGYLLLGNIWDEWEYFKSLKHNVPALFNPEVKSLANIGIFILAHVVAGIWIFTENRKRNKTWRR